MRKAEFQFWSRETFDRVNVVGVSGSGKSTFAKRLSEVLGHSLIEMDAVFWGPNWQQPTDEVFLSRLSKALERSQWVLDGNYDRTLSLKWANVTAVIWIDCSFSRNFFQAIKRAIQRILTQEELWPNTGNRESFRRAFMSRESILLWMLKTHKKKRVRYAERMSDPRFSHIKFFRVRNPSEANELLSAISRLPQSGFRPYEAQ